MSLKSFKHEGVEGFFIEHLQTECENIAQKSGAFLDDLSDWWNYLVNWLVENWDVVLKVLLSLLVFLETP